MNQEYYRISITKDRLKFSSAHMTVFDDGTKEALHGHNYQVTVTVDTQNKSLVSFSELKKILTEICKKMDEKVLIASENRHLKKLKKNASEVSFELCKKRYLMPRDEVLLLPISNISAEDLAAYIFTAFKNKLAAKSKKQIQGASIRVEEFPGQGAEYGARF